MFDSNVNKIFLGTDGAACQILPLQVEGSIPYSAPLTLSAALSVCHKVVSISAFFFSIASLTFLPCTSGARRLFRFGKSVLVLANFPSLLLACYAIPE